MDGPTLSPVRFRECREALLHLLLEHAYEWREKEFKLKCGQMSNMYVDCRQVTLTAEGAELVGKLFLHLIVKLIPTCQGVGGLTVGADPIVTAVTNAANRAYHVGITNGFLVRGEEKNHGKAGLVIGPKRVEAGSEIAVVDDVLTSGGSMIQAIHALRGERDFNVHLALAIVKRSEEDGVGNIMKIAPTMQVVTLFELEELRAARCDHSRFLKYLM